MSSSKLGFVICGVMLGVAMTVAAYEGERITNERKEESTEKQFTKKQYEEILR